MLSCSVGVQLHWAMTKSINRPCRALCSSKSNAPQTLSLGFLLCNFNNPLVVYSYSSRLFSKDEKSDSSLFRLEAEILLLIFCPDQKGEIMQGP